MIITSIIGSADGPTTIFLAGKLGDPFVISAYAILIIFYAIYFIKQISQKIQGIQTRQLGLRGKKEKNIWITEILISLATISIIPIQLISISFHQSNLPTAARTIGMVLGLLGDLIFLIAVLTMKNSWRAGIPDEDKTEFISNGIYQYSRNPAFLGFDLMYISILLMYFNILLLVFTLWTIMMFHLQILNEESYLQTVFGDTYLEYKKNTRRYIGKRKK